MDSGVLMYHINGFLLCHNKLISGSKTKFEQLGIFAANHASSLSIYMFVTLVASLADNHKFMSINLHFMKNVGNFNFGQRGLVKTGFLKKIGRTI